MSLKEGLKVIIDGMWEELENTDNTELRKSLRLYYSQLEVLYKCADVTPASQANPYSLPTHDHRYYINKAKEEFRKEKNFITEEAQSYFIYNTNQVVTAQAALSVGSRVLGPHNTELELKEDGYLHKVE